jgi:acyl-CoA synthetase (AMP-forming)/AMP-acid ligase II
VAWNNQPERLAHRFLVDGEYEESSLTYKALNDQACSIAALLQSSANAGDRALLLFPPGLDFIAAYFGCLYAGIVAVPVYPPHPAALEKTMPALRSIIADAAPAVALLTASLFNAVESTGAMRTTFENLKLLVPRNGELNDLSEKWQKP